MKKYLILLAGCTLLMAACSDFLELDESVYQTTKYQFSTFDRVKQSATNVYSYVQEGLLDVEGTMIDAATDDAVYAWSTGGIKRFYDGSWNGTNLIDDRWASLYSAIAAANYFLDNCPDDFPEAQYQDNYKTNLAELKNYPFEVRALRAYFHFELLRRYNRIVIGDRSFTMQEVNTLVPVSYDDAYREIGRLEIAAHRAPLAEDQSLRIGIVRGFLADKLVNTGIYELLGRGRGFQVTACITAGVVERTGGI